MELEINAFIDYLRQVKGASENTILSYRRDLNNLRNFLKSTGIEEAAKVTPTSLNSYLLYLEREGKAAASIARMLTSARSFFRYEQNMERIRQNPLELIKAPRGEKKKPLLLSDEEVRRLIEAPGEDSAKGIRDRAMLELLYATGIQVCELLRLKMEDINRSVGYICCRSRERERMIPFGNEADLALGRYLESARERLLKGIASEWLFVSYGGRPMTRQGFWKLVKAYGKQAGIRADITPLSLRNLSAPDGGANEI